MRGEDSWAPGEAGTGNAARVHILQPNRDLESNWAVDLAKNLEEYLLKICSGEINTDGVDQCRLSVNFAEAAMLLQGSVQVYSRKVEYLYTLVLHALEFISQKRQDQQDKSSAQPDKAEDNTFVKDDYENFLSLDDVPVETKACLDDELKDDNLKHFMKPPANLLVLEGDCLDANVEANELDSYLLSSCNFYEDFLLLDPCDAEAVYKFLRGKGKVNECDAAGRDSLVKSNTKSSLFSPSAGKSGGKHHKSTPGKKHDVNLNHNLENNFASDAGGNNTSSGRCAEHNSPENDLHHGDVPGAGYPDGDDYSDDDDHDPWKPLNPHEPGNLRIKPFRKGKIFRRGITGFNKRDTIASQFPLAKLEGTINPEFTEMLAKQLHAHAGLRSSESPPLFEKLRQSLMWGNHEAYDGLADSEDESNDAEGDLGHPVSEHDDIHLAKNTVNMDTEVPLHHKKDDYNAQFNDGEACGKDYMDPQRSLEDLCRSHLDTLLASIAETEKQTELAARVSTWKQKIEHTLEDQDSRPPFDIQQYGENILEKLLLEPDTEAGTCFTDIVMGQAKHDIARTFSALLQLVNNGDVDLERQVTGESTCHTSANPFYVRLHALEGREEMKFHHSKKRVKSPLRKGCSKLDFFNSKFASPVKSLHQNGKVSVKLGKGSVIRCTPESKRRRRSRLVEPVDLPSAR